MKTTHVRIDCFWLILKDYEKDNIEIALSFILLTIICKLLDYLHKYKEG